MLSLFPVTRLITTIAAIYAVLLIVVITLSPLYTSPEAGLVDRVILAIRMAGILDILLVIIFFFLWRKLWRRFPSLNSLIFPDLNGEWETTIDWHWLQKKGSKRGYAQIRQNLTSFSIELITNESESQSLSVKPKRDPESGRPQLFYFYRNTPKDEHPGKNDRHEGAAILLVDPKNVNLLEGNYFTSRATGGRLRLARTDHIIN